MMKIFGGKNLKKLAVFVILALYVLSAAAAFGAESAPPLRFYAIDVGQGDSSLFIFPSGETMLVDAGPPASAKKLTRCLKRLGVKKIDLLAATHPHSDHIGGMCRVIEEFAIGEVWDSGYAHGSDLQIKFYTAIRDRGLPFKRVRRGYSREIGGARVEVLGPSTEISGTRSDANNNSVVLLVTYGEVSFLLTGDMEQAQRRGLSPLPGATVLKAAHHGGATGTDAKMLRETRPLVIIFSYGRNNGYGHPHREVLRLLARNPRIKRFDTADGTVWLRTDGKGLTYARDREVMTGEQEN